MKKIWISLMGFLFVLGLSLTGFAASDLPVVDAYINSEATRIMLDSGAKYSGAYFKVGLIDNYYVVEMLGDAEGVESAVKKTDVTIAVISDYITVLNKETVVFQTKMTSVLPSCVAFDEEAIPTGYEFTLLNGFGYTDGTYTNRNTSGNEFYCTELNKTLYTAGIEETSGRVLMAVDGTKRKAALGLVGDVVYRKVLCQQYHNIWSEPLWEKELMAYVLCNVTMQVIYL